MPYNTEQHVRPNPRTAGVVFDVPVHGISMAHKAKLLFAVKFGEILDQPSDKARKDLSAIPCITGEYAGEAVRLDLQRNDLNYRISKKYEELCEARRGAAPCRYFKQDSGAVNALTGRLRR